jgi:hypothetical protein
MAKAAKSTSKKVEPFKTRKSKEQTSQKGDTLTPPGEIAEAIDAFREAQDQAKHYEGEMTIQKDLILNYSEAEYTKRLLNGQNQSFKILGEETMVTYVVMDASSGLTDEDTADFAKRWGKQAAEELITRDFASIRFDGKVLEAHYDEVVAALQTLPEEIVENLFKPMLMKARPGAAEAAKRYAKTPEDLRELLKQLKIKNYIR